MIAQACGGTFSVTGDKNGPPTRPGISLGDTGTGILMAITILGALYKRRETGDGHRPFKMPGWPVRVDGGCGGSNGRSG